MFKLRYKRPRYPYDCKRIREVARAHGEIITLHEAEELWDDYSERASAGWLTLPYTDEELWEIIKEYFLDLDDGFEGEEDE